MPLYEYQCESCGKVTERIQKFSDPPMESCPTCGGRVTKLLSPPAIQFKGSGWYITDYARKSGNGAGKSAADKGSDSESTGKTEGSAKSDTTGASASPPSSSTSSKSD